MAEAAVTFLLEELSSSATEEVSLLRNVGEEVREVKREFISMQAVLKDADAKGETDEAVKAWVKQIREIAYETQDVLDEFMLVHHQNKNSQRCGSVMGIFHCIINFMPNLKSRHQIARKIKDIKARLGEISRRKKDYSLNSSDHAFTSSTSPFDSRTRALFLEDSEVVGINEPKEDLISWLQRHKSKLAVVSVFGIAGLGKTTLLKKVFDDVKRKYSCSAWITVSETYAIRNVITQLGQQLRVPLFSTNDSVMEMKMKISDHLQRKSYVVVLDDIWTCDSWDAIKQALPQGKRTGHILVTTRFSNIAKTCCPNNCDYRYPLKPLPADKAFKLFCRKAFASDDVESISEYQREISQKFLDKCAGLPLAIVSIGGLLQIKEQSTWGQVYENLGNMIRSDEPLSDLNSIFSLSYLDLPYHLKFCFLYLSIFPEDHVIDPSLLTLMWVAEGFVERKPGMKSDQTKEDIAMGYLYELIQRSLVQDVCEESGEVTECGVHDLVREFIRNKAHDQDFLADLDQQQDDREALHRHITGRRLSILTTADMENMREVLKKNRSFSHVRSLTIFGDYLSADMISPPLFSSFKLIRVLKIGYPGMTEFPSEISKLSCLRYLHLKPTKIEKLPSSLGKLENLEILVVESSFLILLPEEIVALKHLTHVRFDTGCRLTVNIQGLTNLEALSYLDIDVKQSSNIVKGLGMLTKMRYLKMSELKLNDGPRLMASVEKMKDLHSLHVWSSEMLAVQDLVTPPQHLRELSLFGILKRCPHWFGRLNNLTKLTLIYSRLKPASLLNILQPLPNLTKMELRNSSREEELHFENGGFLSLKEFILSDDKLKRVKIDKGAMPCIQILKFEHCPMLKRLPLGLEHLSSLRIIDADHMPPKFHHNLQKYKENHGQLARRPLLIFTDLDDSDDGDDSNEDDAIGSQQGEPQEEENLVERANLDFALLDQTIAVDDSDDEDVIGDQQGEPPEQENMQQPEKEFLAERVNLPGGLSHQIFAMRQTSRKPKYTRTQKGKLVKAKLTREEACKDADKLHLIDYGPGISHVTETKQQSSSTEGSIDYNKIFLSNKQVCYTCKEYGHGYQECLWYEYPCYIKGCKYTMNYMTSEVKRSFGRKFLVCSNPNCRGWKWIDPLVEKDDSSEKPSKDQKEEEQQKAKEDEDEDEETEDNIKVIIIEGKSKDVMKVLKKLSLN